MGVESTMPMWVRVLYYAFSSCALGLMILACANCTLINVLGVGLALRGPKGSMDRAVKEMVRASPGKSCVREATPLAPLTSSRGGRAELRPLTRHARSPPTHTGGRAESDVRVLRDRTRLLSHHGDVSYGGAGSAGQS